VSLTHHELCFGCGSANLFGLQVEIEPDDDGRVAGRFFVKQDHQGPPGHVHGGILASALDEAMAMVLWAEGVMAPTRRLEVDLLAPAPVGVFLQLEAQVESRDGGKTWVTGCVRDDERVVAEGRALFVTSG
jgi:acyl-coenzyme A thioesterase PaaI-like protein